jgi:protein-L-isoaspartate(D-aspartate) O-methyltransferase
MNLEQARFNMIEQQIRPCNVLNPEVLALLSVVQREKFVPLAHQAMAFFDTEVPLGHGQHMLSPKIEARILQELALRHHEQVLEIGAGSGHMAALLAHQAREVTSLEIHADLVALAKQNLQQASVNNVQVLQADGALPLTVAGPFDAIVLSGSVAQKPASLLAQLKVGGRLFAVIGMLPVMQATLFTCVGVGSYRTTVLFDTVLPRLLGFGEPSQFAF